MNNVLFSWGIIAGLSPFAYSLHINFLGLWIFSGIFLSIAVFYASINGKLVQSGLE